MTVGDPSTQFKGCRQHVVLQQSVKARRALESLESEEELEFCLLPSQPLYMRAELQGCSAITALANPPDEVALSPRPTDRQRGCLTLSQTRYQITFSAQDRLDMSCLSHVSHHRALTQLFQLMIDICCYQHFLILFHFPHKTPRNKHPNQNQNLGPQTVFFVLGQVLVCFCIQSSLSLQIFSQINVVQKD